MYIETKAKVESLLQDADYVSFTTDIDKVVAVLKDNARNLTLGREKTGFGHLPCLAHTLQLVVKDGLLNAKLMTNLVALCRRIVSSFKYSPQACKVLKKAQTLVGCKAHRLVKDGRTYVIEFNPAHLLRKNQAVSLASSGLKFFFTVETNKAHQLFDRATFTVSSSEVCISEVIPIINSILQQLQVPPPAGFGLQGIVKDLLASLKMRCGQVRGIWLYTAATLLDPGFKGKVFSDRRYLDTSVESVEKAAVSASQSLWNLYSGKITLHEPCVHQQLMKLKHTYRSLLILMSLPTRRTNNTCPD
ncbi:hypothetical protein PR048_020758 [Dryococelus australis]|uniref:Transposase n=1 Tax=Dryococelus australis TaxID=614101 RepID=A0ABQ9GWA2_9NEOP|nr:hypothetical protein PR048_020758 [Dryococelus australis]